MRKRQPSTRSLEFFRCFVVYTHMHTAVQVQAARPRKLNPRTPSHFSSEFLQHVGVPLALQPGEHSNVFFVTAIGLYICAGSMVIAGHPLESPRWVDMLPAVAMPAPSSALLAIPFLNPPMLQTRQGTWSPRHRSPRRTAPLGRPRWRCPSG